MGPCERRSRSSCSSSRPGLPPVAGRPPPTPGREPHAGGEPDAERLRVGDAVALRRRGREPTGAAAEVRVFFIPGGADPCGTVAPVVRMVAGPVTAEVALRELLAGPTDAEAAAGFTSLFGPATADALLDVVVTDGIARVSFGDLRLVIPNASSSCGSAALLAALDATLAQVPGVRGARYSFGGDEAAFYEWLQMAPPD